MQHTAPATPPPQDLRPAVHATCTFHLDILSEVDISQVCTDSSATRHLWLRQAEPPLPPGHPLEAEQVRWSHQPQPAAGRAVRGLEADSLSTLRSPAAGAHRIKRSRGAFQHQH